MIRAARSMTTATGSHAAACGLIISLSMGASKLASAQEPVGRLPSESVIVRRQPIFRALPDATCDLNNARTTETTCKNAIAQARTLIDEILIGRSENALTPAEVNYRTTVKQTIAHDEATLQAISLRAQPELHDVQIHRTNGIRSFDIGPRQKNLSRCRTDTSTWCHWLPNARRPERRSIGTWRLWRGRAGSRFL